MLSEPTRIVISRSVNETEHKQLLSILSELVTSKRDDRYYYIHIAKDNFVDLAVYEFTEALINWNCKVLNVGPRAATFVEGRFPGYIFDLNFMLYRNYMGGIKRYVALTTDTLLDTSIYEPEVFVENFELAVDYFTNVAKLKGVIDIYEEDDREEEGENTF